jgi:predicted alpha/beta superfamily hydrolase
MIKMKQITLILVLILSFPTTASFEKLTSLNNSQYHLFHSKSINHDYHIYVKPPENYEAEPDKKYPTVYLLDGGITFPLLAGYYRYLYLAEELPELMIVGISYGTDDYRLGNRRSTDFTAPAEDRDHYGGAERFSNMLASELFPLIEKNYRSDPNKRILFGQSIAGQFVLYEAMHGSNNFWGHIASNPAIHRNLDYFLSLENRATKNTKLFVSTAEDDEDRFKKPLKKWYKKWRNYKEWQLKLSKLKAHNHFSAAPIAFRNGLKWLFNN